MKRLKFHHLIILYLLLLASPVFLSCVEEEDFPTPPSARISFSADTLDFDTIITHTESRTLQFSIYNESPEGISIRSVRFEGEGSEAFLANVDGASITSEMKESIDCRGKDSLIAFVQFNAQESGQDQAYKSEAKLVFTLANGVKQSLVVRGYSQEVIEMRAKHILTDTTFAATRPIAIYDSIVVEEGATLSLAPGTTLLFAPEASMIVKGTLLAQGTLQNPIIFRGNRYDNMFKNQAYDDIYDQWQGITFTTTSYQNHLDHCNIHAGRWGIECDSSDLSQLKLKLENSIVHNVKRDILRLTNCQTFIGNTQLTNAEGNCVTIFGGDHQFIHCTIGSFSPFSAINRGNALVFSNELNGHSCPIERLSFLNSIITGYSSDEIYAYTSKDPDIPNNYQFQNSLLNTPEILDNPQVYGNIWETNKMEVKRDGNFLNFNLQSLIYDFRLQENSPARHLADPQITQTYYPQDRLGNNRLQADLPDAGCYQYHQ